MENLDGLEVVYVDGYTIENADFKKRVGIVDFFQCSVCNEQKAFRSEYAASFEEKKQFRHVCIGCVSSLPKVVFE